MSKRPVSPLYRAITATIRAEEAAQQVARGDLATKAGIPSRSLHTYLTDQREMSIGQIDAIAKALGFEGAVALAEVACKRLQEP